MALYELSATPTCYKATVANNTNFGGAQLVSFTSPLNSRGIIFQNLSSGAVSVQLNGSNNAIFILEGNTTLTIPPGMMVVTSFDFANQSGYGDGGTSSTVQTIVGLS